MKFADVANDFERRLRITSSELAAIEGPLEEQQERVREVQTQIPELSEALRVVEAVEEECQAANVEENDYTVFTVQDLVFELELVMQSISKKIAFIDNQVCFISVCKDMHLLTGSLDCLTKHDELDTGAVGAIREYFQVL